MHNLVLCVDPTRGSIEKSRESAEFAVREMPGAVISYSEYRCLMSSLRSFDALSLAQDSALSEATRRVAKSPPKDGSADFRAESGFRSGG
jgi:hypothetical protein